MAKKIKQSCQDSAFRVWVCQARMKDGIWYPIPYWGAGNTRIEAARAVRKHIGVNNPIWVNSNGKFTERIRFREYFEKVS